MKRDSRAPLIVAIVLLLVPVLYVGSYLVLVVPSSPPVTRMCIIHTPYRFGYGYASLFFWPLEQIDRKARPDAWSLVTPRIILSGDGEPLGIDFDEP
jgi:hypothetical protein